MIEPRRYLAYALAAAALSGLSAAVAAQQAIVVQAGAPAGGQARVPARTFLPGMYVLGQANVQEQLKLTDEQKEKLRGVGEDYQAKIREHWAGLQGLSAEERREKASAMQQKSRQLMEEARKAAEAVLLPRQLEQLNQIRFRLRAPYMLANPRLLDEIGLDDSQKQRLAEIRQETQERIQQLQRDMFNKALEELTPNQRAKLQQAVLRSYPYGFGYSAPGSSSAPKDQ
jgi:Spy/CpxP family protein refolding chaperone